VLSAAAWILCETFGGLFFRAFGVRLWRYEIAPLVFGVTSPVIWGLAFLLLGPLTWLWLQIEERLPAAGRLWARVAFFATAGPVLEVVLNRGVFIALLGRPLYEYLVLPTFDGSGSLLSPLYYMTLLIHVPWVKRAAGRGRLAVPARAA
jgi:hypothetical protein